MPPSFWNNLRSMALEHITELILIMLFGAVTVSLLWASGQKIDAAIFRFFNTQGTRTPWLDSIMQTLTELGNGFVTGAVALFFFARVSPQVSYVFVLSSLLLWLLVETIKAILRRERPFTGLKDVRVVGQKARGKSFPSGHTSQAFYTATLLLAYMDGNVLAHIIIYVIALVVGITRMYLGMHYPRDVIAGAVLGTFWGGIGIIVNTHIAGSVAGFL
jgi:membrane-associated phospholipid phosphatase